jgi:hypothetical protein
MPNTKKSKKINSSQISKGAIIWVAVIISIVLYLAGVFSGLYANKIIEQQTRMDLSIFKNETKKDIQSIQNEAQQDITIISEYIKFLDTYLKNIQNEDLFEQSLSPEQRCNFSQIRMDELNSQFSYYWDRLPIRIEEYEQENSLSQDYELLKKQYTALSIRTWLNANNRNEQCNSSIVTILYLYSTDCKICVDQGKELDKLKAYVNDQGMDILIFTVDLYSESSVIKFIRSYNKIENPPALVIENSVYQGRVFTFDELKDVVGLK